MRPIFGILDLLLEVLFFRSLQRNQFDRQLTHLAGESKRRLVVVVVHARAGINPDIEGLVDRLEERHGMRDRLTGDFRAIHRQHAGAAFAETGTVILEIKHNGVLAGRERRRAFPAEALQVEKVVHKNWFALEQVEAMASLTAAERIDHAFCTSLEFRPRR